MFVDRVRVKVRGGDGGAGCCSFRREKYVPFGGPDGGDGGNGGSVIFETTTSEQNLNALQYLSHYEGGRGGNGRGKQCHGHNGKDVVVMIPAGTVIKDLENDMQVVRDLDQPGLRFVAAQGGKGGRGNMNFTSSTNRAPRKTTPADEGEYHEYELELKTIADVGLVGYPNAGKSSFLCAVSNAHPETAPYPFTTLHPNVGIVDFPDFFRMTIADIPGLIEGAHQNIGLGHAFLRHIERTAVLVYVLDMAGTDGREPWEDLKSLKKELDLYQKGLSKRGLLIAANKMDEEISAEKLKKLRRHTRLPIYPLCAVLGDGCPELIAELRRLVEIARAEEAVRKAAAAEEARIVEEARIAAEAVRKAEIAAAKAAREAARETARQAAKDEQAEIEDGE